MQAQLRLGLLAVALITPLAGQSPPYLFYRGVYNAASFTPPGLPGAAIAQGSIFTLFGRNLGPATPATATFPLNPTLAGTGLEVCLASVCQPVFPLFVSASQINALLPSNAPTGRVTLRARVNGVNSNWLTIDTVPASPGLFSINAAGFGPGIVQNFTSPTDAPINSLGNVAEPGQTLVLYGTGLGPISTPDNQPAPAGNVGTVEVLLGAQVLTPAYAGRTPGFAGLDQVNFTIPANAPAGCYVPLRIRSNRAVTSNTVTIAIGSRRGQRCADAHNPLSAPISLGQRIAAVLPQRWFNDVDVDPFAPFNFSQEWLMARIGQPAPNDFAFSPFSLPPPGACGAYTQSGNLLKGDLRFPVIPDSTSALRLRLSGARIFELDSTPADIFSHVANLTYGLTSLVQHFFTTPTAALAAPGLEGQLPAPAPLTLLNPNSLRALSRQQTLTLNWSGATPSDQPVIALAAYDEAHNATALLACLALPGQNTFQIPAALLQTLPHTPRASSNYFAILALGRFPTSPAALNAPGFDLSLGFVAPWSSLNIWLN
jgi:uncharacterized protein (TIGR03437 family)